MIEQQQGPTLGVRFREFSALERIKKYYWGTTGTTILVTNRWKRAKKTPFLVNSLETFLHSLIALGFSLKFAPLHSQCWATRILEHWDDCNTQINIEEGETHTNVSRFLTSIAALGVPSREVFALKCLFFKITFTTHTHTTFHYQRQ